MKKTITSTTTTGVHSKHVQLWKPLEFSCYFFSAYSGSGSKKVNFYSIHTYNLSRCTKGAERNAKNNATLISNTQISTQLVLINFKYRLQCLLIQPVYVFMVCVTISCFISCSHFESICFFFLFYIWHFKFEIFDRTK